MIEKGVFVLHSFIILTKAFHWSFIKTSGNHIYMLLFFFKLIAIENFYLS